jgi:hypothetical protein
MQSSADRHQKSSPFEPAAPPQGVGTRRPRLTPRPQAQGGLAKRPAEPLVRHAAASALRLRDLDGLELVNLIRAVYGLERIGGGHSESMPGLRVFPGVPRTFNEVGSRLRARRAWS